MAEYKSLYRKWRPKIFADVFGQEHITRVLENQVINKKVSHAYLFCGSRGTGKTTCAKILAKAVNCENLINENGSPCNECATCVGIETGGIIDVVEIDAASNNGVDNIRELREEVAFTPSGAEKKVYIVDEVHMMTIPAFNALLKTLEEPPPHIIFILATTEVNKIPATILSRCQRHDFRRIAPEIIAEKLRLVCDGEGIEIEERALGLIARLAGGAMRDALSILEVARGEDNQVITLEYVTKIAGHFDGGNILDICECIKNKDAAGALIIFWEMYEASLDCTNFCGSLLEAFRNIQVAKIMREPVKYISADMDTEDAARIANLALEFDSRDLMRCYELTSDILSGLGRYTANKRVAVEMLLFEMCLTQTTQTSAPQVSINEQDAPTITQSMPMQPAKSGKSIDMADLAEEVAKENKIVSQYLKGTTCEIDGRKIIIKSDSDFKASILKEHIAVIKKYAEQFVSGIHEVVIELATQESGSAVQNSIHDINV